MCSKEIVKAAAVQRMAVTIHITAAGGQENQRKQKFSTPDFALDGVLMDTPETAFRDADGSNEL